MSGTAEGLREAVDAVVQQDLSSLSLDQLQEQVSAVAGQVQHLSGFTALAMARVHTRTGGELTTDDGRSRSVAGWAADATRDSASATGRLIRVAGPSTRVCRSSRRRSWAASSASVTRRFSPGWSARSTRPPCSSARSR